jgi:hypothetical protein
MELRHLRYLCAVAEHGTFSEAGRRLRVSQSAISEQIADLEREVGGQLLNRSSSRTRLTPRVRSFSLRLVKLWQPPTEPSKSPKAPSSDKSVPSVSDSSFGAPAASSPASSATTVNSTRTSSSHSTRCARPSRWKPSSPARSTSPSPAPFEPPFDQDPPRRAALSRPRRRRPSLRPSSRGQTHLDRLSGHRTLRPLRSPDDARPLRRHRSPMFRCRFLSQYRQHLLDLVRRCHSGRIRRRRRLRSLRSPLPPPSRSRLIPAGSAKPLHGDYRGLEPSERRPNPTELPSPGPREQGPHPAHPRRINRVLRARLLRHFSV